MLSLKSFVNTDTAVKHSYDRVKMFHLFQVRDHVGVCPYNVVTTFCHLQFKYRMCVSQLTSDYMVLQ